MKKMNIIFSLVLVVITLTSACRQRSTNTPASLTAVNPAAEPKNFKEWNDQYLLGIKHLHDYTFILNDIITRAKQVSLQRIAQKSQTVAKLVEGDGAAPAGNADFENFLKAQGAMVQNMGLNMQNIAAHNKAMAEVDGAQIENVGKVLQNVNQGLDNALKNIEVHLRQHYLTAYSDYVRSYSKYAKFISGLYVKIDQNSKKGVGAALKDFTNYEKQSAICSNRAARIWKSQQSEANAELKQLTFATVTEFFNRVSAKPNGEACLQRVLLTSHAENDKYLYGLDYAVASAYGQKKTIECAKVVDGTGPLPDEMWESDFDLMEYPQYIRGPKGIEGMYRPVTYFQLYKLLTNNTYTVKINPPPSNHRDFCHKIMEDGKEISSQDYDQKRYVSLSREFEKSLAEQIKIQDTELIGGYHSFSPLDNTKANIRSANSNPSYVSLVQRLDGVFAATDRCIDMNQKTNEESIPSPATSSSAAAAPVTPATLTAVSPESVLDKFYDPTMPDMSKSIQSCMNLAENYRVEAARKINLTDMIHAVLAKMADTKPPRAPHPVQLQPAIAPLNRAGNDF